MKRIYALALIFILFSCSTTEKREVVQEDVVDLSMPKPDWVKARVEEAQTRLIQSEAGAIVWKAIEFHGGLEEWWSNGPLYFRFNYQPKPGTGTIRDTYETADYWSSKTRHQRVEDQSVEYGWDGEKAWYKPDTAQIPYNVRFWALTPYYFAGMPFVFADAGVNLSKEDDIQYEEHAHHVVRVTFGEDVGDAPDDYYVLYVHSETFRLSAIRYVVSYPGYFKNGGHSQEKLMTYEGQQTVNGIIFPVKHKTFMWTAEGEIGEYVTDITLSDLAYRSNTKQSYFEMPEGSKAIEGLTH